jgi:hypothetical protein
MKLWLDDVRPMPAGFDISAKTSGEAIAILKAYPITFLSLWDLVVFGSAAKRRAQTVASGGNAGILSASVSDRQCAALRQTLAFLRRLCRPCGPFQRES